MFYLPFFGTFWLPLYTSCVLWSPVLAFLIQISFSDNIYILCCLLSLFPPPWWGSVYETNFLGFILFTLWQCYAGCSMIMMVLKDFEFWI